MKITKEDIVPMSECIQGRVYRIISRNLSLGVYDGKEGFIGIRYKFGSRYLFTEYHWDQGPPFGTVSAQKDTGIDVPEDIEIRENVDTYDSHTGRLVAFDKPKSQGGKGWYFRDTGESSDTIYATTNTYKPLFEFLEKMEKEMGLYD